MGSNLEPDVRNEASNEISDQYLDAAKARTMLGWSPAFTFDAGLRATVDWYTRVTSVADERIPVVILCGGSGTRLAEQTEVRPKPLVEIGGRPILWHIMKHYSRYGFNEFVLALGLQGRSDQALLPRLSRGRSGHDDLAAGRPRRAAQQHVEPWKVHLVDTGEATLTGGRLRQLQPLIGEGTFMLTYGDGVGERPARRAAGVSSLARRRS